MANELKFLGYPSHGLATVYVVIRVGASFVKRDGSLISATPANIPAAAVSLSDSLRPGDYLGDMPAGAPAGEYVYTPYVKAGGAPVDGDTAIGSQGAVDWNGTAEITLSTIGAPPTLIITESVG